MSLIQKGQTYSWFNPHVCPKCSLKRECVRASAFWADERRYFWLSKGMEEPPTEAMQRGQDLHTLETLGYPTLDDYGYENFLSDARRFPVTLKEVMVCNNEVGIRGRVDLLTLRSFPDGIHVRITEIKHGFRPTYYLQLAAYAMIFSTRHVILHIKDKPFYVRPFQQKKVINVWGQFIINREPIPPIHFIHNNMATEAANGYMMAVQKRRKRFLSFHRVGLYAVDQIPYCKGCTYEHPRCGLSSFCFDHPYRPEGEQMAFGKAKPLVKLKVRR